MTFGTNRFDKQVAEYERFIFYFLLSLLYAQNKQSSRSTFLDGIT